MIALTRCQQRRQQLDAVKEGEALMRRNSAPLVVDKPPPLAVASPSLLRDVRNWSKQRNEKKQTTNTNAKSLLTKKKSVPTTLEVDGKLAPSKLRNRFGDHLDGRTIRSSSSANSESILHFAVSNEDLATVKRLLRQGGVDVNNLRPPGVTPLHQACALGNLEIVKVLLEYNADIDLTTWQGLSPLKVAVSRLNFEVAEYLLQQGAEAGDIKDGFQNTMGGTRKTRKSKRSK